MGAYVLILHAPGVFFFKIVSVTKLQVQTSCNIDNSTVFMCIFSEDTTNCTAQQYPCFVQVGVPGLPNT